MTERDPGQVLARRLRALREERWPGRKVSQAQLAAVLGTSVPLISSWEKQKDPAVPPAARIQDIARFFASPRSFDGPRLLRPDELTAQEQAAEEQLLEELTRLRTEALDSRGTTRRPRLTPDVTHPTTEAFSAGPYRFKAGERITIVCGQVPAEMLKSSLHRPLGSRLHRHVPVFGSRTRSSSCLATCEPSMLPAGSSSGPRISCQKTTTQDILSHWAVWTGTWRQRRARTSSASGAPG